MSQPLYQTLNATPDAYPVNGSDGLGAGDDYIAFGLFGGPQILVDLGGIDGATSFTVSANDVIADDGELSLAEISAANPDQVVCFAKGTPITTERGEVPVKRLGVGDRVQTYDGGHNPIRWIGSSRVALNRINDDLVPIRFAPDALGPGQPARPVSVSPAHRILWRGAAAELLFGASEVLIPAKFLVNDRTILRDHGQRSVTYWHFMFDDHQIVFSAGLKSESFFPAPYAIGTMARNTRDELFRLFPELTHHDPGKTMKLARPALRRDEFNVLASTFAGAG